MFRRTRYTLPGKAALLAWLLFAGSAAPAGSVQSDPIYGVWRNPRGTIDIRTAPCNDGLCGAIVRASPQAVADAKDAGVTTLIGLELLQDYHRAATGRWTGLVYVPDMGRSFSSHIEQVGPDQLRISGCLWRGWVCKSQLWHRI